MIKQVLLKDIIEKTITGEWGVEGNNVKVLRTTNFTNEGRLDFSNVVERYIDEKKIAAKKLNKGDIIIEKSGGSPTQPVGRVVYFEADGVFLCNNFTAVLRPKSDLVFSKYLHYILFTNHKFGFTSAYQNKTTGIINLQLTKYIEGVEIPLPPLQVQQKIAAILDAADELRQRDKALVAKYDELTQALFLDMFGDPVTNSKGWEKVELKKLCAFKKKNIKPEEIIKGTNYVALDSIEKETGKIITIYNVEQGEIKSNKFWFDDSYILYGKLRPYLNKVALPDFEGVCSTDIIPIQPIIKISNRSFISAILKHPSFVSFAHERSSGANLPRISPTEVEKYLTISPPFILQNQFAERVKVIEEQKKIAQASALKSEELFNSLLQKAFNGELV